MASAGNDGKVHVWRVATGKDVFNTPSYSGVITSLAWSPTSPSLIVSASADSQVDVWDISKPYTENPTVPYREHTVQVNGVAWSTDGKEIASGDERGNVRVWDAATGNDLSVYQDYPRINNTYVEVTAISWSSDTKSVAIGHSEYARYSGYQYYHTVEMMKFCRSWCLFQ